MKKIERLGLGTMGMSRKNWNTSVKTIHAALDAGITLFNTGDFYNGGMSEMVVAEAMKDVPRDKIFLSVKFGALPAPNGHNYGLDVKPHNIKSYMTYSLRRLNMDYIDLYQPGRLDTEIPVEDVVGAIADLVKAGHIGHIGLSHVSAAELRRGHAVHPIHTVELGYSLIDRSMEKDLVETAQELGIKIVAHGITAKGLLRDGVLDRVPDPQNKLMNTENLEMVRKLQEIAYSKGMTLTQLALVWSLAKYPHVQSIVGTTNPVHLQHYVEALQYDLSAEEVMVIEEAMPEENIVGKDTHTVVFTNGIWTVL